MDVSIVSPESKVWEGEADLVVARSPEGEFGIMRGHIPFLAALVPGRISIVSGSQRDEFFVPGGFLEASGSDDYHVIVLADDAESLSDIDKAEARRRLEDARRRARDEADDRAEAMLRVEMARVEIAESRE
jgi:F-type H+-transporting ATPase subunit epsilon